MDDILFLPKRKADKIPSAVVVVGGGRSTTWEPCSDF